MALETLTMPMNPDWGMGPDVKADVYEGKLGDGYVVRRPNGINYLRESWNPSWSNLDKSQATTLYDWLKERLQLTPFMWQDPISDTQKKVVCTKVSMAASTVGIYQVAATFEQDFNPS